MRSVAPITKIVPLFLWSAKMPKIYAKCQKSMQKLWNFIFCHLDIVRAVYKLSFKLLVRSVAPLTKIVPPFVWFRGGLCYKYRRIRHGGLLRDYEPSDNLRFKLYPGPPARCSWSWCCCCCCSWCWPWQQWPCSPAGGSPATTTTTSFIIFSVQILQQLWERWINK